MDYREASDNFATFIALSVLIMTGFVADRIMHKCPIIEDTTCKVELARYKRDCKTCVCQGPE
jgi:hypothetical protein